MCRWTHLRRVVHPRCGVVVDARILCTVVDHGVLVGFVHPLGRGCGEAEGGNQNVSDHGSFSVVTGRQPHRQCDSPFGEGTVLAIPDRISPAMAQFGGSGHRLLVDLDSETWRVQ